MPDTKTLLTMTRYSVAANGTLSVDRSKSFSVMINPAEFSHERAIGYNRPKVQGRARTQLKFSGVNPDSVGFSIVLDGTGAVPPARPGAAVRAVKDQMDSLLGVVYAYVGERHEPSHVRLLWGSLIFFGRLSSMSTQYTLFKPSGDPLRAKVTMKFEGSMSKSEEQLVANRSSPDLNHLVVVKEGDTLPLLCNSIYGDPTYYPEVARFNELVEFRALTPGTTLRFPPLE